MLWLVILALVLALGAGLWFAGQKGWLPAWVPWAKKKDGYMAYDEEEDDEADFDDDDGDVLVIGGRAVSGRR